MIYKLEKVTFAYNGKKVINIDSLNIEKGRIYALIGPNGSGKTTLLKLLNGLLKANTGLIHYKGEPIEINKFKNLRNDTVYVHQNPLLLTGTVYKNVAYGLKIRKNPNNLTAETMAKILSLVGLDGFEYRKNKDLSVGEVKRVAIARALAISPKVLLLDEPTAHIDKKSIEKISNMLKEINNKHNTTIIFSSHDDQFSKNIADEIIYIENGGLKQ